MKTGDWIETFSGLKFYPLDPQPEDICIEDIAHALALQCRYNGHSRVFYSVAEHSVRMSRLDLPGCPKWRLMHDAAEAYISDVPSPIKPMLRGFKKIEESISMIIGKKYSLGIPNHTEIKYADMVMLAMEKRDILMQGGPQWRIELPNPLFKHKIHPWKWQKAKTEFLLRFIELEIT